MIHQNTSSFDPREAASTLFRRKWLVVIPVLLVSTVALVGSYFITPQYESSAVVWSGNPVKLSNEVAGMLGGFRDIVGTQGAPRQDVRDYQRQILSLSYVTLVFEKLKLDDDPELTARAQQRAGSRPEMDLRSIKIMLTAQRLQKDLELSFISNSHIRISAKASESRAARNLAQAVSEVFIQEQAREELRAIFMSSDFSQELLARYEKELQNKRDERTQLEKDIGKWQGSNAITSEPNRNDLASEIERRKLEMAELTNERRLLTTSLDRLGRSDFMLSTSSSLTQNSRKIDELITSIEGLVLEYAWKDPSVDKLALRFVRLEDEMEEERRRLVDEKFKELDLASRDQIVKFQNIDYRLNVLDRYVKSLRAGLTKLENNLSLLPEYRAKLDQLTREVQVAESLRDRFRAQLNSFEISQDLVEETRFRIVDAAQVEPEPIWPDRRMILLAGLVAGLFLGGAAVFAVEFSDRSLKSAAAVEEFLGQTVIGIIPQIKMRG